MISNALKIFSSISDFYFLQGRIYQKLSRNRKAINAYEKGIEIHKVSYRKKIKFRCDMICLTPNYINALIELGKLYFKTQNKKKALYYYDLVIKYSPDNYIGYVCRGLYFLENNRNLEYAIKDFSYAIIYGPTILCYSLRAKAYLQNKQYTFALQDCNRLLSDGVLIRTVFERQPKCKVKLYKIRIAIYQAMKKYEEALLDIKRMKNITPKNPKLYLLEANIHSLNKDTLKAQKCLQEYKKILLFKKE